MVKTILLPMQKTQEMRIPSQGQEALLEEVMATHSSTLAWRSPRTEEPGRLLSMVSQRVGHNRAIKHKAYTCSLQSQEKRLEPLGGDERYKAGLCKRENCQQTCLRLD